MVVRERVWGKMKEKFPSSASYCDYLLFEIQQCLVDINDLREKKSDIKENSARLHVFVNALMNEQNVDEKLIEKMHSTVLNS